MQRRYAAALSRGGLPDATLHKGAHLGELVTVILGLLAERPCDLVPIDLSRLPVSQALGAFDSWIGLKARLREALATNGNTTRSCPAQCPSGPANCFD